jgi:hypothetical protein
VLGVALLATLLMALAAPWHMLLVRLPEPQLMALPMDVVRMAALLATTMADANRLTVVLSVVRGWESTWSNMLDRMLSMRHQLSRRSRKE